MPFSQGWAATAAMTRSFAFSIAIASRLLLKSREWSYLKGQVASSFWRVAAMNSPIVSTVIRAATSPAAWPPMPSATMKRPSERSTAKASSLCFRLRPTSVSPKASIEGMLGLDGFLRSNFVERAAHFAGRRIPPKRLLVRLLRFHEKAGLTKDRPGVLQERDVVAVQG